MKKRFLRSAMALCLALSLLVGVLPVSAAETEHRARLGTFGQVVLHLIARQITVCRDGLFVPERRLFVRQDSSFRIDFLRVGRCG